MDVIRPTLIWFSVMACLFIVAARLQAAKSITYGGSIRLASKYDVRSVDPIAVENPTEMQVVMMSFDRLVAYRRDGEWYPNIASDWRPNGNFTTWDFQLQKGIRFHDGTPLRAKDVKSSFERLIKSGHSWVGRYLARVVTGAKEFVQGEQAEISGLVVSNAQKISIQTHVPQPNLLELLALPQCSIVKATGGEPVSHAASTGRKAPSRSLVGSGPFLISSNDRGKLTFNAFDFYFEGRPFLNKVELDYRVTPKQQLIGFKLGKLDFIELALSEKTSAERESSATWFASPRIFTILMGINPNVLKSTVREAIDKTLEKDIILKVLLKGEGKLASGYFPPEIAEFAPLREKRVRRIDWAQKLMAREPQPVVERPLSFMLRSGDDYAVAIAQRIAVNLRDLGLKAQVELLADDVFASRFQKGKYDLFLDSFFLNSLDTELELSSFLARYSHAITAQRLAKANGLLRNAEPLLNTDERLKELYLAEKELLEDYTLLPLFHINPISLANDTLAGFWYDPLGHVHFEDAWRK